MDEICQGTPERCDLRTVMSDKNRLNDRPVFFKSHFFVLGNLLDMKEAPGHCFATEYTFRQIVSTFAR